MLPHVDINGLWSHDLSLVVVEIYVSFEAIQGEGLTLTLVFTD